MAGRRNHDLACVRKVILAERSAGQKLVLAVLLVAVPALVRWLLDGGQAGYPFATFYPAVVVAAVLLDWPLAAAVAIAAGVFTTRVFPRNPVADLPLHTRATVTLLYFLATAVLVGIGAILRNALAELNALNERQALHGQELVHRFKNMVAVVNALALQTVRSSPPDQFHAALSGRLNALARASDIAALELRHCDVGEIVAAAVAPFQDGDRIRFTGPPATLHGKEATALMLALHELATNAVKYGALANAGGAVTIDWTVADPRAIALAWRERGGPPVAEPSHTGFGTRLLASQGHLLRVERRFAPDGLDCDIAIGG